MEIQGESFLSVDNLSLILFSEAAREFTPFIQIQTPRPRVPIGPCLQPRLM